MLLALALLLGASALPSRAGEADQANLDILVDTIRANRKALVAANLKLSDEEAGKFWPAYANYQTEMNAVQDRMVKLIEDYTASFGSLSDDKATKLVEDYLAVEEDRVKVRRAHLAKMTAALPGKKVARFYQIENKMDAVVRYDLAATIPVVEE
jgi:hypothetical protein